jgi:hypothetical protein
MLYVPFIGTGFILFPLSCQEFLPVAHSEKKDSERGLRALADGREYAQRIVPSSSIGGIKLGSIISSFYEKGTHLKSSVQETTGVPFPYTVYWHCKSLKWYRGGA